MKSTSIVLFAAIFSSLLSAPAQGASTSTGTLMVNGKCISLIASTDKAGATPVVEPCGTSGMNQSFIITAIATIPGGYYTIQDATSSTCLSNGSSYAADAALTTAACNSADPSQQIQIQRYPARGAYNVLFRYSGLCMFMQGTGAANGSSVVQNTCVFGSTGYSNAIGLTLPAPAAITSETPRMSDSFVDAMGVDTHVTYSSYVSNMPGLETALGNLGIRHIRDGGGIWMGQSTSPTSMTQNYAEYNRLATLYGIHMTLVTDRANNNDCGDPMGPIADIFAYLSPSYIDAFEGLNELDANKLCTTSSYSWEAEDHSFQSNLWSEVQGAGSPGNQIPVINPPMGFPQDAINLVGANAVSSYGNMTAIHSYPAGGMPSLSLSALSQVYPEAQGQPYDATETGYYNYPDGSQGVDEPTSGKYIGRLFGEYFNAGVARTFIYELLDQNDASAGAQQNYGLLNQDLSAKPQYTVMQNMIGLLSDQGASFTPTALTYSMSTSAANLHHTLLEKRNGTYELLLWQEELSYNTTTEADITVPSQTATITLGNAANVSVYNPNVSATATNAYSNVKSVSVSVPDEVIVVQITPIVISASVLTGSHLLSPAKSSAMCVVPSGSANGDQMEIEPCASSDAFTVNEVSSGEYELIVASTGKCLDLTGGSATNGTILQQWACSSGDKNQLFKLVADGSSYNLVSVATGSCVDLTAGATASGTEVQEWTCSLGDRNQAWNLPAPAAAVTGSHLITPVKSSAMCLVPSGSANGDQMEIETCDSSADQFQINQVSTGEYQLVYSGSGKCLDLTNANTTNGTIFQQWACNSTDKNQLFKINPVGTAYQIVSVVSDKCVDLTAGGTSAGTQAQEWACGSGDANQEWDLQ